MGKHEELFKLIDKQARSLVGTLCKRIEVLDKENSLSPNLYKALAKELVYENFRALKEFVKVYFLVGKIVFVSKSSK